MKTAKRILFGAMSLLMLAACSDDKLSEGPDSPVGPTQEAGVYFSLQIDLPNSSGSRSVTDEPGVNGSTSNSGVEVGKDYENTVIEALIVLADAHNNEFIAAATVNGGDLHATDAKKSAYVAKSKFSKTQLASYYDWLDENGGEWFSKDKQSLTANIFVFCNPTQALRASLLGGTLTTGEEVEAPIAGTSDWVNYVGHMSETHSIWAQNSFLMSNALIAERELPASIDQWNRFTTSDNPFNLSQSNAVTDDLTLDNSATKSRGSIKVERTCARFDFRDGSQDNVEGKINTGKAFTYNVLFYEENDVLTTQPIVQVTLQKMFLVNQSNSYYYLPHLVEPAASGNGRSVVTELKGDAGKQLLISGICQPERPWAFDGNGGFDKPYGNYVVDYDFTWKNSVYLDWKDNFEQGDKENEGDGTTGSTSIQSDFDKYFNYPFFNNDGTIDNTDMYTNRWQTYLCSDVVKGEANNTEGWTASNQDYKIWRYTTENTIPSIEGQINGVSTGVVFKAKYSSPALPEGADDNLKAVAAAINNEDPIKADDPVLYLFANKLYCGWQALREAALQAADAKFTFVKTGESDGKVEGYWELHSINRTNSLYRAVFGTGGVGTLTFTYKDDGNGGKTETAEWKDDLAIDDNCANEAWIAWDKAGRPDNNVLENGDKLTEEQEAVKNAYKNAVTDAGITIYQRSYDGQFGYGYYCYYYYWNRHNDNGFNGIMGPMEFAVVRNNVYKLAVTKISQLGHPRISENDPHKPGPGTPDEDESVYIEVTSEILPWVVRVNNIDF